jgi:cobalt/nickel transport system permease protein
MHLPDGFIDAPTAVATAAGSVAAVAWATRRAGREMGERTVPLLGVTAAFIFAAQMLNFPVAAGTSGHFLGAAFAAVLLGPWAAVVVMTVVVCVQAVGMADGGITALGANVLNMGVIAVAAGYWTHRFLRRVLPATVTGYLASVGIAAWASVVAAAAATAVELAASGTVPLRFSLPAMTAVHVVIGIGEALITVTVLATVLASRPDLVRSGPRVTAGSGPAAASGGAIKARPKRPWGFAVLGLALAVALALVVSPLASQAPDGLERVAIDLGFDTSGLGGWDLSPLPDYGLPGISDAGLATAIGGALGTLALFAILLLLGRRFSAATPAPQGPVAQGLHPLGGHEHTDHRHSGHTHAGHHHSSHVPEDDDPHHSHPHGSSA